MSYNLLKKIKSFFGLKRKVKNEKEVIEPTDKSKSTEDKEKKTESVLIAGKEMSVIYDALSELNEKEIKEAILQKNKLKKEHIFDVLSARGKITYKDIFLKIKELCAPYEASGKLIFEELASEIKIEEGKSYLIIGDVGKKYKRRVTLAYMPIIKLVEESKYPTLILPKDQYHVAISRQARDTSFSSETKSNFTFLSIIEEAITRNVSDVHVTYSEHYYYISFRLDGDLIAQSKYLLSKRDGDLFLRKIKQEASRYTKGAFNADEHNLPQDARLEYPKLKADVRLSFIPKGTLSGENALTARILIQQEISKEDFSFRDMGYDDDFVDLLDHSARLNSGLILIAGVTGSGKSTLLSYFTVQLPSSKRIITFEDPIEFKMKGSHISQHQRYVPSDKSIAFDFSDGVKQAKRSDPDVFYIGEIRKDKGNTDLIDSVVESAKAGQLVLSTVHINSAFDIYKALETVFGVDTKTSSGLILLTINQVLVKTLCPHCKVKDVNNFNRKRLKNADESGMIRYAFKNDLESFLESDTITYIRNKKGCSRCNHGTIGRKPIYEFLKPDVETVQWISEGNIERFKIEEKTCSKQNKYLAKNKLTNYVEAIINGELDTHYDVMDKIIA